MKITESHLNQIKSEAETIHEIDKLEDVPITGNRLSRTIAQRMLEYHGYYTYRKDATKILIILTTHEPTAQ